MAKKFKLTRAELNEKAWEKKKKQTKGHLRGSRANPNLVESHVNTVQSNRTEATVAKQTKVVRAIPLYIPGREQPLVSSKLEHTIATVNNELEPSLQEAEPKLSVVDFVVSKSGQLVSTSKLQQQAKQKARAARHASTKQQDKAIGTNTKVEYTGSVKLGKAALRRLEREQVALGAESEFLDHNVKTKKTKSISSTSTLSLKSSDKHNQDQGRILSRDYKSGRNTNYVANQANAEKALRRTKNSKVSGEELLELWESLK